MPTSGAGCSSGIRHLLQELCFEIRGFGDDEYIANISLRIDVQAQDRFQLDPLADPPMAGMPTAAEIIPAAQGIQLPLGVKLDQPTPQPAQCVLDDPRKALE